MEDVDYDDDQDLLFHFKKQELNLTENGTDIHLTSRKKQLSQSSNRQSFFLEIGQRLYLRFEANGSQRP